MTLESSNSNEFTEAFTREILLKACREVGIKPSSVVLLRHQTNGVFFLEDEMLVAKVARPDYGIEHTRRIVETVRWLMRLDFPTAPLADFDQPIVTDGIAVTFWKYLAQGRTVRAADIAAPLRRLHSLGRPPAAVPALDAIPAIWYSIANESILSKDEHEYLAARCTDLAAAAHELQYEEPSRLLHGDPQHANALWNIDHAVLSDWDSLVIGPAEWDLVTIDVHCRRFNYPPDEYEEFCAGYGRDVRQWNGYRILRDMRELRMIATNARKSAPGSTSAAEVKRRITQLRQRNDEYVWSIL
jgi:phosphotransferase family enzyme